MNEKVEANQLLKEFRSELLNGMMIWKDDKKMLDVLNHVLEVFDSKFSDIN